MITVTAGTLALVPGMQTGFGASGGTAPYSWAVLPGGAGGTIGVGSGIYVAPAVVGDTTDKLYDTIEVTDSAVVPLTMTAKILVGTPLHLLCDIVQKEMGFTDDQVYLWDQKIEIPIDERMYVAVGVESVKPFANSNSPNSSGPGIASVQSANFMATCSIDILSRGPSARDRKEEILLTLFSDYSKSQQYTNSFHIARLSSGFTNLSEIDGAAIPYRFHISVRMQYMVRKTKPVPYIDSFEEAVVTTEP